MALHPDYIAKGLGESMILDGEWHYTPPEEPPYGTYISINSLLGKLDPDNLPDTNFGVKAMRWKPGAGGILVPDEVDNGTAWDAATTQDLVTSTWAGTWPSKFVVSATYPGVSLAYRGQGGAATLEQVIMKLLRQRTT